MKAFSLLPTKKVIIYMTLEKVFRPYFKMMQKSLQKNELFAEDEEIFDIYIDVLEKTGKTVQRGKIGTLI